MINLTIVITATVPFDVVFSSDPVVADCECNEFIFRATDKLIEAGMGEIGHMRPTDIDIVFDSFDFDTAVTTDAGFVLPVLNRDCAERLLNAGLLDQSHAEIVRRWGNVMPSIRSRRKRRRSE